MFVALQRSERWNLKLAVFKCSLKFPRLSWRLETVSARSCGIEITRRGSLKPVQHPRKRNIVIGVVQNVYNGRVLLPQPGRVGCFHRSCKLLHQLCKNLNVAALTWPLIGSQLRSACSQTDDNLDWSWVCVNRPILATVHRHAISHAAKPGIHPGVLLPRLLSPTWSH